MELGHKYLKSRNRTKSFSAQDKSSLKSLISIVQYKQRQERHQRNLRLAEQKKRQRQEREEMAGKGRDKRLQHLKFTLGGMIEAKFTLGEDVILRGYKFFMLIRLLKGSKEEVLALLDRERTVFINGGGDDIGNVDNGDDKSKGKGKGKYKEDKQHRVCFSMRFGDGIGVSLLVGGRLDCYVIDHHQGGKVLLFEVMPEVVHEFVLQAVMGHGIVRQTEQGVEILG